MPQPLRTVQVLFSPMASGWECGQQEKVSPVYISQIVRNGNLLLGRDTGWGGVHYGVIFI